MWGRTCHPPIGRLNLLQNLKSSLKSLTPDTSQAGGSPYLAAAAGLCRKSVVFHPFSSHPPSFSQNARTAALIDSLVFGGHQFAATHASVAACGGRDGKLGSVVVQKPHPRPAIAATAETRTELGAYSVPHIRIYNIIILSGYYSSTHPKEIATAQAEENAQIYSCPSTGSCSA